MICISIGNIELIAKVNELKPDLVEVRYDLIKELPGDINAVLDEDIKQIATCRPGLFSDLQRIELMKSAIDYGVSYIDLEIESESTYFAELMEYACQKDCDVIVSYHNYENTPPLDELKSILSECFERGADLAKIACLATSEKDSERLLSLYSLKGRKVILGMGDQGKITRIKATEMGAEFTFVSADSNELTAPGQLTYEEYRSVKKRLNKK
ncbi:MAG: type I 3-dehydroquinate dehydratase [Bacteroidales bacterium]|jgi:3-dehydroquinate dehydratase-1|nr:type I 3-dehydroquinate dehydratase [Bacteroidales bacterium]